MAAASEVPSRFDVIINGQGYLLADVEEVKAQFGYTPTFVTRQNTQGDYGDNQQDFWLTWTQRDWSLGEEQKYFRQADDLAPRRYSTGTNVDVRVPGAVGMRYAKTSVSFPASPVAMVAGGLASSNIFAATASNLYEVDPSGTATDRGAHGLGVSPSRHGIANDASAKIYLTSSVNPTVGVRKWTGSVFNTFSASGADALAFLNNTLYGLRNTTCDLVRWDTSGALTSLFPWLTADGAAFLPGGSNGSKLLPYGGDLLIYFGGVSPSSLWLYDGTGVVLLHRFDPGFVGSDAVVSNGICYVAGVLQQTINGSTYGVQAVYYFAQGTPGLLWKSQAAPGLSVVGPSIAPFDGGVVWTEAATNQFMYYNLADGGVQRFGLSTLGTITVGGRRSFLSGGVLTSADLYPSSSIATTTTVTSSLVDFDSSLDKLFLGARVDFDAATDGDGGSVDVSYRVNDTAGAFTLLQAGAVSGAEYKFPAGVSGRSIAIKATLNRGTSTLGPVLKRKSVRAAPQQFPFRRDTFILNCTGRDGKMPVRLRDGTYHPKDGLEMATELRSAARSGTPVSITDEFGSFTGIIENDGFQLKRVRQNEFIAVVPVREV
jgi:hypothetical protein